LEPLRKQSRTLRGSELDLTFYEIPFAQREEFESAWPHILKVKSKGAPVTLVRVPNTRLGTRFNPGVRIQSPPRQTGNRVEPEASIDTTDSTGLRARERWMSTTVIELVVDGEIVDLNRIPLPADTPMIDERFKGAQDKPKSNGSAKEGRRVPRERSREQRVADAQLAGPPGDLVEPRGERSLEQRVADAQVIVVATALDSAPAPAKGPGDLPEVLIRFQVRRVLKGNLAGKALTTRTPTAAAGFIGKDWVIMLSPEYMAGQHEFADCNWINDEPDVMAILSNNTK
jgi:hypothetical protein